MAEDVLELVIKGDSSGLVTAFAAATSSVELIKKAFELLKDVIVDAVEASMEEELGQRELADAMYSAGIATQEAFNHTVEYANALESQSMYTEDAIYSAEKMFITFGVHGKQLEELTQATIDFAARTGKDLNSAAELVARTIGGTSESLGRYKIGIEGTANSTERITSITENMAKLFGGSAAGSIETMAGKIKLAKDAQDDLYKAVGNQILPMLRDFSEATLTLSKNVGLVELLTRSVAVTIAVIRSLIDIEVLGWSIFQNMMQSFMAPFDLIGKIFNIVSSGALSAKEKMEMVGIATKQVAKETGGAWANTAKTTMDNVSSISKDLIRAFSGDSAILVAIDKDKNNKILTSDTDYFKSYIAAAKSAYDKNKQAKQDEYVTIAMLNGMTYDDAVKTYTNMQSAYKTNTDLMIEYSKTAADSMSGAFNVFFTAMATGNDSMARAAIKTLSFIVQSVGDMIFAWLSAEAGKHIALAVAALTNPLTAALAPSEFLAGGLLSAAAGTAKGVAYGAASAIMSQASNFADGGVINEPIHGVGASGKRYSFGENGAERISPITNNMNSGHTISIGNITVGKNADATAFIFELERRTGARILRR